MDLLPTQNGPETCLSFGLDCGTCMRKAGASIARICQGLDPQGVQQLFLQLYPSPGCWPMAQAFELAYRESSIIAQPDRVTAAAAA